ncbi:hypothetical protein EDEG_02624 [Edhazardia aedis USNM 41457]|uniref:Uncharacterized protein n=1 Tax=Edhazardia aedis (strain USNM 41457) TaxID=1003232 RepID=J9DK42_EDHAE|nr:hypothetical protein EDEG_02624 [Edhazardia aedis USNM 41457]|eukprot:EJW02980.1 hypothetical protein EDEG_02624 [Edhazardia aedis USNM 41457]
MEKNLRNMLLKLYMSRSSIDDETLKLIENADIIYKLMAYHLFPNSNLEIGFFSQIDPRIASFIIERILRININSTRVTHEVVEKKKILEYLILIENKYFDIYDSCPDFFTEIFEKLSDSEKNDILLYKSRGMSKIILNMLLCVDKIDSRSAFTDLWHILKNSPQSFFMNYNNLIQLRKKILNDKHLHVNIIYKQLLDIYPEMLQPNFKIHRNRLLFFQNPSLIPLKSKWIHTYCDAIVYKHRNNLKNTDFEKSIKKILNENMNLLIMSIIIHNYLQVKTATKKFCKQILSPFIKKSPQLIRILMARRFDILHIENILKYTEEFVNSFGIALEYLIRYPRNIFYEKFMLIYIHKYQKNSYIKELYKKRDIFSDNFNREMEKFYDTISGEKQKAQHEIIIKHDV